MKKPEESKLRKNINFLLIAFALVLMGTNATAQTTDEEDEDGFFTEMDKENFKSDFGNDNNQRSIDYSEGNRSRRSDDNYNIFGKEQDMPVYKFEEENQNINGNRNSNGVMIQGGGNSSNGPIVHTPENANIPSVTDPFRQGQTGVKAPRNMDAVPDNGDDPNDVPLDGGVVILGLAATAFGYRKMKK